MTSAVVMETGAMSAPMTSAVAMEIGAMSAPMTSAVAMEIVAMTAPMTSAVAPEIGAMTAPTTSAMNAIAVMIGGTTAVMIVRMTATVCPHLVTVNVRPCAVQTAVGEGEDERSFWWPRNDLTVLTQLNGGDCRESVLFCVSG